MFSFFPLSYTVVSDKVALVIGNQQYQCEKLQGLFYSEKDAYDVAHVLSNLGFKVRVVGYNAPAAVHENKSVLSPHPCSPFLIGWKARSEGVAEIEPTVTVCQTRDVTKSPLLVNFTV